MPGLFNSSKTTNQSGSSNSNLNSTTQGAFDQTGTTSATGSTAQTGSNVQAGQFGQTGSVAPTLDPSMQPLIPAIAGKASDLLNMSPSDLVPDLNDQIKFGATQVNAATTQGLGQYNNNMGENNAAIKGAMGTLTSDPGIAFDGSGIPSAVSGTGARDVNAATIAGATVDPSTIINDMNPYQTTVIDTQNALMQRNAATALAQLRAGNAGQKAFGDRAAVSEDQLLTNLNLNNSATLAGLAQSGYTTAQQQAEADAARTLQTQQSNQGANLSAQQSNQGADVNLQQRIANASLANQQTGLAKAQDTTQAQEAEAAAKAAQAATVGALSTQSGALAGNFLNANIGAGNADIAAGQPQQGVLQARANAPVTQLGDVSSVVYGSPQGQTSTQAGTSGQAGTSTQAGTSQQSGTSAQSGTSTSNTQGTSNTTTSGTSSTSSNPSIFQDILGAASIAGGGFGFKRGGLMRRYADGGALDDAPDDQEGALDQTNPAVQDWYAGKVHSSDMGGIDDAPLDAPGLPQMQIDAAAMRMPAPRARADVSDVAPAGSRFHGALSRFVDNMANSPLSQFGMGVLATPQSGLVPLSSGMQAVLAHRAELSRQALESAQTDTAREALRERQTLFGFQKQALEEEYPGAPQPPDPSVSAGPGSAGPGSAALAPALTPGGVGGAGVAAPPTAQPRPVPSDAVPLSLQWMQKGFERNRRLALAGMPAAGAMADKFLGMLQKAIPENMQFNSKTSAFEYLPGYLAGKQQEAGDIAAAKAGPEAWANYYRSAGSPQHVAPNETVVPGIMPPFPFPGQKGSPVATGPGAQAAVQPAPTFTPNPNSETPAADEANSDTRPFTPVRDANGMVTSPWTDLTKKQMDAFDVARTKAVDAAEHAQESDNDLQRLKSAFTAMKAKGTNTGYYTPAMGQLAAMAKSLGIDTTPLDKFVPTKDAVGDIQTANKVSKEMMGEILHKMYPQRITNADQTINKGIAPGPDIDEAANSNLVDQITRQNSYDKTFAKEILGVDATNPRAALGFQRAFYKKYGFGPLAGTYFSQAHGGQVSGKEFSSAPPKGLPTGSYPTGLVTKDGNGEIWRTPDGKSKVVSKAAPQPGAP